MSKAKERISNTMSTYGTSLVYGSILVTGPLEIGIALISFHRSTKRYYFGDSFMNWFNQIKGASAVLASSNIRALIVQYGFV